MIWKRQEECSSLELRGYKTLAMVLTRGERGTTDAGVEPKELADLRVNEEKEALKLLGCSSLLILLSSFYLVLLLMQ